MTNDPNNPTPTPTHPPIYLAKSDELEEKDFSVFRLKKKRFFLSDSYIPPTWVCATTTDLYCESRLDKNLWAELAVL
jgi:hypothetical protein